MIRPFTTPDRRWRRWSAKGDPLHPFHWVAGRRAFSIPSRDSPRENSHSPNHRNSASGPGRGYAVTDVVVTWNPIEINVGDPPPKPSARTATASSIRPLSSSRCAVTFVIEQLKPLLPIASAVCSYPIPASDAVAIARRNSPGPRTGEVRSAVYVSLTVPAPRAAVKPHSNSPVVVVNCIPVTGTETLCSEVIVPITGSVSSIPLS